MTGQFERGIRPPIGQRGDGHFIGGGAFGRANPTIRLASYIGSDDGNGGNIRTGVPRYVERLSGKDPSSAVAT